MPGSKNVFDSKFGADFIGSVPMGAGVYEMQDAGGSTLYVGKAKRLRRRLQQYRNARRCKRHHKMRMILEAASKIKLTACADDRHAQILENRLIQDLRPRFNVAGAFSFLYPHVCIKREGTTLYLAVTTDASQFRGFKIYGAYRSRLITREGYFGLLGLLGYIGHREPSRKLKAIPRPKHSHVAAFRQISDPWVALLEGFLAGESRQFLEKAVGALLEKPIACRSAAEIQECLNGLKRFYKFEAAALRRALRANGISGYGVSQAERDRVFIIMRTQASTTVIGVSTGRADCSS